MLEPTELLIKEICREYREAKDQKAQVKILADLNGMTPYEMLSLLRDAGQDVDMRWYLAPDRRKRTGDTMKRVRAEAEDGAGGQETPHPSAEADTFPSRGRQDGEILTPPDVWDPARICDELQRRSAELKERRKQIREELTEILDVLEKIGEEIARIDMMWTAAVPMAAAGKNGRENG